MIVFKILTVIQIVIFIIFIITGALALGNWLDYDYDDFDWWLARFIFVGIMEVIFMVARALIYLGTII